MWTLSEAFKVTHIPRGCYYSPIRIPFSRGVGQVPILPVLEPGKPGLATTMPAMMAC